MTQDGMHGTTGASQSNTNGNTKNVSTSNDIGDGFEFSVDDEEGEKEEEQNISNTIGNYNDNEDELNIDDICNLLFYQFIYVFSCVPTSHY